MQQIDKVYIDGAFVTPHGETTMSRILERRPASGPDD